MDKYLIVIFREERTYQPMDLINFNSFGDIYRICSKDKIWSVINRHIKKYYKYKKEDLEIFENIIYVKDGWEQNCIGFCLNVKEIMG